MPQLPDVLTDQEMDQLQQEQSAQLPDILTDEEMNKLSAPPPQQPSIQVPSASGPVTLTGDQALKYGQGLQASPLDPNFHEQSGLRKLAGGLMQTVGSGLAGAGRLASKEASALGLKGLSDFDLQKAKDVENFAQTTQPGAMTTVGNLIGGAGELATGPVGLGLAGANAALTPVDEALQKQEAGQAVDWKSVIAHSVAKAGLEVTVNKLFQMGLTGKAVEGIFKNVAPGLAKDAGRIAARAGMGTVAAAGQTGGENLLEGRPVTQGMGTAIPLGIAMEVGGGAIHDARAPRTEAPKLSAEEQAAAAPAQPTPAAPEAEAPPVTQAETPAKPTAAAVSDEAGKMPEVTEPAPKPAVTREQQKANLMSAARPGEIIHGADASSLEGIAKSGIQPSELSGTVDAEQVPEGGFGKDVPSTAASYAMGARNKNPVLIVLKPHTNRGTPDMGLVRHVAATSDNSSYVKPEDIAGVIFPDGERLNLPRALKRIRDEQAAAAPQMKPELKAALDAVTQRDPKAQGSQYLNDLKQRAETVPAEKAGKLVQEINASFPGTTRRPPKAGEMPGAGPAAADSPEFQYGTGERFTSTKNSTTDEQRAARGSEPLTSGPGKTEAASLEEAKTKLRLDPEAPTRLIAEMQSHPRALTPEENDLLALHKTDLNNQLDGAAEGMDRALERGDDATRVEHAQQIAVVSDKLDELERVLRQVGQKSGQSLQARKKMVAEDFTLGQMVTRTRAAKGGRRLTAPELEGVKQEHAKITKLQKELNDHETKADETTATTASKRDFQNRIRKPGKPRPPKDAATVQADLTNRLKDGVKEGLPPTRLGSLIQRLAEHFVRQGTRDRDKLVDQVHDVIKDILPDWSRRKTMDAISGYGDFKPLNPDEIKTALRDLKGQMQQIGKIEDMTAGKAPSKTGVERRVPSDEERRLIQQVNELKRQGGFDVTDPAKQLKSALDAIKNRLKNQITDLGTQIISGSKIIAQKTGVAYDAEANALKADRDALKGTFDQVFGKSELTDAQRVSMAMKAIEKSIAEYDRRIKEGDLFPGKKPSKTPNTPELAAARSRRDALKEELILLQKAARPPKSPEEVALQAFKTRTANRIAELNDRVARGDFENHRRLPMALDTEGLKLRAALENAKQAFANARERDRLVNRTTAEKVQDTFVKWRRASLLSSPLTIAKLVSAAVERMITSPIEEVAGAALGRLIPGVAKRADVEGGLNVRAESKSMAAGFTQGMRDAWQVLRSGQSDLKAVYGNKSNRPHLPPTALDFLGTLHAALHAPTERNAFVRAFEKGAAAAMRNGLDASDPAVQIRIANEAFKASQRSVFMQNNRVVDIANMVPRMLEAPSKETGRPTVAGKAGATAFRSLLPIVRVPTNIVAETMQYALGTVSGGARLARAYARGIENLKPEEADLIMRSLKKGSVGMAVMALGYFNPDTVGGYYQPGEKRKPGDVRAGSVRVFGVDVPSYLIHNPLLESLQIGATIRRVGDSFRRKSDTEPQGIGEGTWAAASGVIEEVPFVRETLDEGKLLDPNERGQQLGDLANSFLVPQLVQTVARASDIGPDGQPTPRKPEGVLQHIEMGIPGLRQTVPEKAAKEAKHPHALY